MAQARPCQHCGKARGDHKAKTLQCPVGMKTRVGYCSYGATVYEPRARRIRRDTP